MVACTEGIASPIHLTAVTKQSNNLFVFPNFLESVPCVEAKLTPRYWIRVIWGNTLIEFIRLNDKLLGKTHRQQIGFHSSPPVYSIQLVLIATVVCKIPTRHSKAPFPLQSSFCFQWPNSRPKTPFSCDQTPKSLASLLIPASLFMPLFIFFMNYLAQPLMPCLGSHFDIYFL